MEFLELIEYLWTFSFKLSLKRRSWMFSSQHQQHVSISSKNAAAGSNCQEK